MQEVDPRKAAALEAKLEGMNCQLEAISEEDAETEVCSAVPLPPLWRADHAHRLAVAIKL